MNQLVQIVTAIDDRAAADKIAEELVERRLAACVQVFGPVRSTYRWQGKVTSSDEWLLLIKTTRERAEEVQNAIGQLHTYDTPEIIATEIILGHEPYLDWVRQSVKRDQP